MENRGLLFIPDISGFSEFVGRMEIDHSRMIIQELLETLMASNDLGLKVAEVEGDAILFYRFGPSPPLLQLSAQVEKMFCEFHRRLRAYEVHKYCHCKACCAATGLTLKIITHYGEFTSYTVGNFEKLIGRDIIVAHQLLKNDIDRHEYWLITRQLAGSDGPPAGLKEWMTWQGSVKRTESGEIPFHYTQLGRLKDELKPESVPRLDISSMNRELRVSRDFLTDIITLFHASGDFQYRGRWQEGVRAVEAMMHSLPRVGMQCRCVMDSGQVTISSSSYSFGTERIEFSETDHENGKVTSYTLEQAGDGKTRLTIDLYSKKTFLGRLFGARTRRKLEERYARSLLNLEGVVEEIGLPG